MNKYSTLSEVGITGALGLAVTAITGSLFLEAARHHQAVIEIILGAAFYLFAIIPLFSAVYCAVVGIEILRKKLEDNRLLTSMKPGARRRAALARRMGPEGMAAIDSMAKQISEQGSAAFDGKTAARVKGEQVLNPRESKRILQKAVKTVAKNTGMPVAEVSRLAYLGMEDLKKQADEAIAARTLWGVESTVIPESIPDVFDEQMLALRDLWVKARSILAGLTVEDQHFVEQLPFYLADSLRVFARAGSMGMKVQGPAAVMLREQLAGFASRMEEVLENAGALVLSDMAARSSFVAEVTGKRAALRLER